MVQFLSGRGGEGDGCGVYVADLPSLLYLRRFLMCLYCFYGAGGRSIVGAHFLINNNVL